MRTRLAVLLALVAAPAAASVVELPPGKRARIKHAAWTSDGRGLVLVGDKTAWSWDASGKATRRVGDWEHSRDFSVDGRNLRLASLRDRSIVQIWDLGEDRERTPIGGKTLTGKAVALDASGRWFAYAADDGVHLHDLESGSALETAFFPQERVLDLALGGPYRLLTVDSYGRVRIRDLGKKKPVRVSEPVFDPPMLLSRTESHAAAGGRQIRTKKIAAWRVSDGSPAGSWSLPEDVLPLSISPDGSEVLGFGAPEPRAPTGLYRFAKGRAPKLACAMDRGALSIDPSGVRPDHGFVLVWERQGSFELPERLSLYDVGRCAFRGQIEAGADSWALGALDGRWDGSGAFGDKRKRRDGLLAEFLSEEDR